jgi:hypothetical protein
VTSKSTAREREYRSEMEAHLRSAIDQYGARFVMDGFAKYASRQAVTTFLARKYIFDIIQSVHGSIIECGVYAGQGLMTWAQLSSILEPVGGVTREVFGFDTFTGFPSVSDIDTSNTRRMQHAVGDLAVDGAERDVAKCIQLYDKNRFLSQFPKVHLIKGDFLETSGRFAEQWPRVIPALLYLDFDLYEPTRHALEVFFPRMPKGSGVAFDELNDTAWPGETRAFYEVLDVKRVRLQKVPFHHKISYFIVE